MRAFLSVCSILAEFAATAAAAPDPFAGAVYRTSDARTGRVSSWDRTGGNRDWVAFAPGEARELVRLDGPGVLTHIYMTPAASTAFLRDGVLRMYWDDETEPSVEAPFGDFFCAGECNSECCLACWLMVGPNDFPEPGLIEQYRTRFGGDRPGWRLDPCDDQDPRVVRAARQSLDTGLAVAAR